jgi:hypothetical protein
MVDSPGPLPWLRAAADDLSVALSWPEPPGGLAVEVQRSEGGGPFKALGPEPGGRVDTMVSYGGRYAYRARLVRVAGETRMPGPWTEAAGVLVEDTSPPPPPGRLDAAVGPDGIRLAWESLAGRGDVAGYRLYRSEAGSGSFTRLGGLLTGNVYTDRTAASSRSWRYRVTAVDDSPRANESAPSPEAEVFSESAEEAGAAVPERPELADPGF